MSNTDPHAREHRCPPDRGTGEARVQVLTPREVPLGGPRAMTVRRTLPHRERSFVGAWCFVDHYGPDEVTATGGMDVAPHPHSGLQTVSWLFEGEIEHRDSGGEQALVRPGEVNLMTGAHGIAHSEVSTPATRRLHGVQLWVVLPEADRGLPRELQSLPAPQVALADGATMRLFAGSLAGSTSPLRTRTRLLGAELHVPAGTSLRLPVHTEDEHAVLLDRGALAFCGQPLEPGELGVVDAGRRVVTLDAQSDAVCLLLGGEPFGEEIVMWWNFIGRDHDEIVALREQWEAGSERFGTVIGYRPARPGGLERLPAPGLPGGRLRPRGGGR